MKFPPKNLVFDTPPPPCEMPSGNREMRDYIAIEAMRCILSHSGNSFDAAGLAKVCYDLADAMQEASSK